MRLSIGDQYCNKKYGLWAVVSVAARGYLPPGANVCVAAPHPVAYLEIWKGTFQVYIFKSFQILAYFSQ